MTQIRAINRVPKWLTQADLDFMLMYYERAQYMTECTGELWTVDHIIPLQGNNISGLHVPTNLRILTHSENSGNYHKEFTYAT